MVLNKWVFLLLPQIALRLEKQTGELLWRNFLENNPEKIIRSLSKNIL